VASTTVDYEFDGLRRQLTLFDGDGTKPLVLLLHGALGDARHMTDPATAPGNNYDYASALGGRVTIGWRAYPGVGVWSCCHLDPTKDVRSWQAVLEAYRFRTAVYSQVDPGGFLARPVEELVVVMDTLIKVAPDSSIVVLAHSRGGLLIRKFLKDHANRSGPIRTVITLHAPHTGSALASVAAVVRGWIESLHDVIGDIVFDVLGWLYEMANSDAFLEMSVGSAFLTDLAAGEQALEGIDYYTFGGVSVRLARVRSWVYTLASAVPNWHTPPFFHERDEIEVPGVSPLADTLPNVIEELSDGRGDLLTADSRTRLDFATHQTNPINHAEALWDEILQAQVLRILGEEVVIGDRPGLRPSFWR
jgi:pimeloyl-ACP methyl ester carboxylesterase